VKFDDLLKKSHVVVDPGDLWMVEIQVVGLGANGSQREHWSYFEDDSEVRNYCY